MKIAKGKVNEEPKLFNFSYSEKNFWPTSCSRTHPSTPCVNFDSHQASTIPHTLAQDLSLPNENLIFGGRAECFLPKTFIGSVFNEPIINWSSTSVLEPRDSPISNPWRRGFYCTRVVCSSSPPDIACWKRVHPRPPNSILMTRSSKHCSGIPASDLVYYPPRLHPNGHPVGDAMSTSWFRLA